MDKDATKDALGKMLNLPPLPAVILNQCTHEDKMDM